MRGVEDSLLDILTAPEPGQRFLRLLGLILDDQPTGTLWHAGDGQEEEDGKCAAEVGEVMPGKVGPHHVGDQGAQGHGQGGDRTQETPDPRLRALGDLKIKRKKSCLNETMVR